ncbi:MAG: rRNA adenine N-6-methyltransferase family protein, partial [Candidatus Zixiibacteriota bacterium]
GPERFTPPPKVSSTVVALARLAQPPDCLPVLFERTVRVAFANRRKTLLNNLISGFSLSRPGVQEILDRLELAHNIRAEELSTERFISLAGVLESD